MRDSILKVDKVLKEPVEKVVNQTLLGNCLYLNKKDMESGRQRKNKEEYEGNWQLFQTLSQASRSKLKDDNMKGLKLRIRIFSSSDMSGKSMVDEYCAVSRASGSYTITWSKQIKIALQKLFPISTVIAISSSEGTNNIRKESPLSETIAINSFTDENGGWNIYPGKQVNNQIQDTNYNSEYQLILSVLKDYAKDLYLNTSKKGESSRSHDNAFKLSTKWKNAAEFEGAITAMQNCIYTLATDPDEDGKCSIYVGEAISLGGRLTRFSINNKYYIDHTRKEAKERQFTRFRIDQLKPEAYKFLHDAQDSIIGALWMLKEECPNGYTMINSQLCSAISQAYQEDLITRNK